jgi:hypothetical protein
MRAFLAAVAAVIVISVAAGVILNATDKTTGQKYATDSVRLN